ncbi:MAG: hypothetical protein ACYC41_09600, partial [Bacillota bacterium]
VWAPSTCPASAPCTTRPRTPWAGAVGLLGTTPYMSRKAIRVERGPEDLALLSLALNVESTLRRDSTTRADMFLEAWADHGPWTAG